ncbi:MAG: NUDIX hydrolase [Alphaproteobacteria bacterium]|nr:NUDIX hydrolase [Alphaproteobacteria bacterium]
MSELVRLVNANDRFITPRIRGSAKKPGEFVRIAAVIVFRSNGKVLLARVSRNKSMEALKWAYSSSGHIDAAETTRQAAWRELKEELGITAALKDLKFIGKTRSAADNFIHVFKLKSDTPATFNPVEIEEIKEFTPAELRQILSTDRNQFRKCTGEILDRILN